MFLVDLIFEWYGYAMISYLFIYLFIFLFRSNVRKGYLDEDNLRHCFGIFFKSVVSKVSWSQRS